MTTQHGWFTTKEKRWIAKWNTLQVENQQGCFLQLTTWMQSYVAYGFDFELLLCIDKDENILCGSGNIIVKLPLFKFYVCSHGPLLINKDVGLIKEYLTRFILRSKELHVIASQISFSDFPESVSLNGFLKGNIFPKVSSLKDYNLVRLYEKEDTCFDEEKTLSSFSSTGRRDVRASYRKGLSVRIAVTKEEIEEAYHIFDINSRNKGYQVRSWEDIKASLIESVEKNHAFLLTAWFEGKIQGAILLYQGGRVMNYVMGGVMRHKPDLMTGYFLQFGAMKIAYKLGIRYYNITSGGPKEVKDFKLKFNPTKYEFVGSYYYIHSSFKYKIFSFIQTHLHSKMTLLVHLVKCINQKSI